jgi:hypothetical protein
MACVCGRCGIFTEQTAQSAVRQEFQSPGPAVGLTARSSGPAACGPSSCPVISVADLVAFATTELVS